MLGDMYVTPGVNLQATNSCSFVVELDSNQEEADTQMLLHAKHASSTYTTTVIATLGTDMFMITLSKQSEIQARIFILTGTREKRRLIDTQALSKCIHQIQQNKVHKG